MKKNTYLLFILLVLASCKFDPNPYSFNREFDGGTYITPGGIVKYLSGAPDSAILISDNYAIIKEDITYHKEGANGMHLDSILIYGHCFSLEPGPLAIEGTVINNIENLTENTVFRFIGSSKPESFIPVTELGKGIPFNNTLSLHYETDYYIKSFVVTGRFKSNGDPEYEDIAYNQYELKITTKKPVDLWVGGTMQDAPVFFPYGNIKGATSFSYDGYMFVALGHNESDLLSSITVYRYDPVNNEWTTPYPDYIIAADKNFTNSVAFVIENVPISAGIYRDCVYIGTGLIKNTGELNKDFLRLDLEKGNWKNISTGHDSQPFQGLARENAVAFTINGIGYVGLGNLDDSTPLDDFYKFDPTDRLMTEDGTGHAYGYWEQIDYFDYELTKAVTFKLSDNVYVCCGENKSGNKLKTVYMCRQTTGDWLSWSQREDFPGTARIDAVAFNIGEMGYVGTGLDDLGPTKDYYRYDPFLNIWEEKADFGGQARSEAVGQGIKISDSDYRGYIGGGWDAEPHPNSVYYNDYWHYRP